MNYTELFLKERKTLFLDVERHALIRCNEYNVNDEELEKVFRIGKINFDKSEAFPDRRYNKICLSLYFGKTNKTIELILLHYVKEKIGEVRTIWAYKGKKTKRRRKNV